MGYTGEGYTMALPAQTRYLRLLLIVAVILFISWLVGGQSLWFSLNVMEFGELFVRPIYFEMIGGLLLAIIALVRIDIRNRRSLSWWVFRLLLRVSREKGELETVPREYFDFKSFRLSPINFILWQATKVLIGLLYFREAMFGMAVYAAFDGWDPGIKELWRILQLPFVTPPFDMSYAQRTVLPHMAALTLLVTPVLGALGTRLLLLYIVTQLARIVTPTPDELAGVTPQLRWRIANVELLVSVALAWVFLNAFLPPLIDFNTRYVIIGLAAGILLFAFMGLKDSLRAARILVPTSRQVYLRVGAALLIMLVVGSVITANNSIADARKVEWRGPYVAQQVAVNRFLAQLDEVKESPYNFSIVQTPPERINEYVAQNRDLLRKVRLWDWNAAFAKLKPEIGLIPYLDFEDSDILRFNGTLYWSASMKPTLPATVRQEDRWYASHLYYSHVPNGFLILDANEGKIIDSAKFFQQRKIYFGEGGLFARMWAAYPLGRDRSDELGGAMYDGAGGVDLKPPLSWAFDANFFWAYRERGVHMIRYRDVYDRMSTLFPYFEYQFAGKRLDILPVSSGDRTYWLMPLIIRLDTRHVPWSAGNPLFRLVGYALIDVYDGKVTLIVLGNDFFSQLFKHAYREFVTTEVPSWLRGQLRYPEELFEWRVNMFNFYHVRDPSTYIVAKEFFEIPRGLVTYYVIAKPPGFDKPEFLGLLSLELRGAGGRNLAGYMVVRNDYPSLGEMVFYAVPLQAETKLLGPTAVMEALEKNADFAKLKTLLRQPRIGDNIFYRIGDHDVYLLPVYTAGAGGVITELGVVAAVGAAFTGETYVGLGENAEDAFRAYLAQVSGIKRPPSPLERPLEERRLDLIKLFRENKISLVEPVVVNPNISILEGKTTYTSLSEWNSTKTVVLGFIEKWGKGADRVYAWSEESKINFGVMVNVKGVVELHYVTVSLK